MFYTRSDEEKTLEPNLAHLRANSPGAERMRTGGTSRVCIDRIRLLRSRGPGFVPKPAPRSIEWFEIDLHRLSANSDHQSLVYPVLDLVYRATEVFER